MNGKELRGEMGRDESETVVHSREGGKIKIVGVECVDQFEEVPDGG